MVYAQFVPMRNFVGRGGDDVAAVQERLAKEVLEEIPDQFLSYMKRHNVKPKPPLQRQGTISSVRSLPASEQWEVKELQWIWGPVFCYYYHKHTRMKVCWVFLGAGGRAGFCWGFFTTPTTFHQCAYGNSWSVIGSRMFPMLTNQQNLGDSGLLVFTYFRPGEGN